MTGNRTTVLAAMAAVILVVTGILGYDIARRVSSPEAPVISPQTATAAGSASRAPAKELSVLDQPRPVPETRFQDEHGHDLTLTDFRGRVVLLNIWATWCVPCRQEMPTLDRLQARLGGDDFLVLALSIDRKGVEPVRGFYQEVGVKKLAIYVDPAGKTSHALAIPGVPTTLLIDRDGREVARKLGAAEWDGPEMVSLIEETLRRHSASNAGQTR